MEQGFISDELKELFMSFSVDLLELNIPECLSESAFVHNVIGEQALRTCICDLSAFIGYLSKGIRLTKNLTEQSVDIIPTVYVFEFDIDTEPGLWEKEQVNSKCLLVYDLIYTFICIFLSLSILFLLSTIIYLQNHIWNADICFTSMEEFIYTTNK